MLSEQKTQYIQKYNAPVIWNVSGFGNTEIMKYLMDLHDFCKSHKIEFPIQSVHGMFNSRFNGGRECLCVADDKIIRNSVKVFNDNDIGVKLMLSNMKLSEKDFDDPELRFLLDCISERSSENTRNAVICVSDKFAEFIRKNYPNLEIISSHVKMEMETKMGITDTPEYYNNLFNLYDIVVMNTYRAFDDEFLSQIEHPERVEFIVNHVCRTNCQISCQHHKLIDELSELKAKLVSGEIKSEDPACVASHKNLQKLMFYCNHSIDFQNEDKVKYMNINHEEMNHLCDLGITHFKIEGRDLPIYRMMQSLGKWVFNPESCISMYRIGEMFIG